MANSLKIIVSSGNGNQNVKENNPIQLATNQNSSALLIARSVYANQLVHTGMNMIKSEFNYQINRVGDTTGDYLLQDKINQALSVSSVVSSIGGSIAAGFATGGVIGASVGAVVSLSSLALRNSQAQRTYNYNLAKTNANAMFSSSQIGDILNNGNRG